jgi:hypothetical protein
MATQPLFNPTYLNVEYLFGKIVDGVKYVLSYAPDLHIPIWLTFFLSLATIFFITVIIYSLIRIHEIQKEEQRQLKQIIVTEPAPNVKNPRWEKIKAHMLKDSPAEWRVAIIEADVILDEMVTRMGYKGDSLADKLKAVERSDFSTIQLAWEAHLIRNRIAHGGSDFNLTRHEAVRVIALYEEVFREFDFI